MPHRPENRRGVKNSCFLQRSKFLAIFVKRFHIHFFCCVTVKTIYSFYQILLPPFKVILSIMGKKKKNIVDRGSGDQISAKEQCRVVRSEVSANPRLTGIKRPLTKPGSDRVGLRIGSDWYLRFWCRIVILRKAVLRMTQVACIFSSEPLVKKKNRFSSITRLNIHHQLENHRKVLFSTELLWQIICCIALHDYNSEIGLGYETSPESKMAERDVSISHCTDFVFLSISTLF